MASSKKPRPGELPARLVSQLAQALQPGQTLLLGLSGGLDSCVLLHLLAGARATLGFELRALHVNHGLSPHAADWERFCASLCAEFQVPYAAECVSVARDSGLGLEAAARQARYGVLLAQEVDAVVLAHHQDDQAETLLLQLLRGAGIKGLAAMPGVSEAIPGQPLLLRPLLDVPRTALQTYADSHNLRWIEDESNLDLAYDRNFLRHHVFPALQQRFPASRVTLARSAAHMAEAAALLDEVAGQDAAQLVRQGRLDVAGLRALSTARAKNLLRYWLASHLPAAPSTQRLQEIHRQLLQARPEANLLLALEGGAVRRYRGEAWFERELSPSQPDAPTWHGESTLPFAGGHLHFHQVIGAGLSLARLGDKGLQIRVRQGGERLRPDSRRPARSLKYLFQQAGLPPWQRTCLPLIYRAGELVAVPGIGIASDWQAKAGEAGLLIDWRRD